MQLNKAPKKSNRNAVSDNFYHSPAWRAKRKLILKRDNYRCQPCKRKGHVTEGNTVDHIKPIEQGGSKLGDKNLETTCPRCHAIKSAKERKNIR